MTIRRAATEDIPHIIDIAEATWPETYGAILSPSQLRYMLQLFYSSDALHDQMETQGHTFLVLEENGRTLAFASYSPVDAGRWKLHKLYILPGQQGKGLGRKLIDHIAADLREKGAGALLLNVNRYNKARQFYEKLGFEVIAEEDIDIGEGFFMNDFIMRLQL